MWCAHAASGLLATSPLSLDELLLEDDEELEELLDEDELDDELDDELLLEDDEELEELLDESDEEDPLPEPLADGNGIAPCCIGSLDDEDMVRFSLETRSSTHRERGGDTRESLSL